MQTEQVDMAETATRSVPIWAWAIVGAALGLVLGCVPGIAHGEMEYVLIMPILVMPAATVVGALAGVVAARWGGGSVVPLATAYFGGMITPLGHTRGWIIGGLVGGLSVGLVTLSARGILRWTLIGAASGLAVWFAYETYLFRMIRWVNSIGD